MALNPRERMLVMVALPLVLLAASYQFLWKPLDAARAGAREDIAGYRQIVAATDALPPPGADAPRRAAPGVPLNARITQSADAAGLILRRLEPEGARIRLSFDDTPFDQLLVWIEAVERDLSARVVAAEITRRPVPGTVTARLTLEEAR